MNKILVIEDDKGIRENLKLLLKAEKYQVEVASNGIEGIKIAKEIHPDLIICDIMMPDMDGYEVIKAINADDQFALLPFIFLTAKVERSEVRKGMNLGADDYILKPYDADELLAAVHCRLNKFETIKAKLNKEDSSSKTYTMESKLLFRVANHSEPVSVSKIVCISAERQYSTLTLENNHRYVIKKSLSSWELMLPKEHFIRVHRSEIVNLNHVSRIANDIGNHYKIYLVNTSKTIEVSRRYYKKLRTLHSS